MKDKDVLKAIKKMLSSVSLEEYNAAVRNMDIYCPKDFGLDDVENNDFCTTSCEECWKRALEDINIEEE